MLGALKRSEPSARFAKIETAGALSGNLKTRVRADLFRIYGPALRTSFVQTPALSSGMRITVGSDLYDGSVRGTLAALEGATRD
jgi:F0F1-type ATP synthase delta subunit